jgi:hypothetical protein
MEIMRNLERPHNTGVRKCARHALGDANTSRQLDRKLPPLRPGFAVTRHTRWICGLNQWFTEDGFRACVYDVAGTSAGSITAMTCLGADIPSFFSRPASSGPIFVR